MLATHRVLAAKLILVRSQIVATADSGRSCEKPASSSKADQQAYTSFCAVEKPSLVLLQLPLPPLRLSLKQCQPCFGRVSRGSELQIV